MTALKLIVGLGNPSPQYDSTRHNVGALWVRSLARQYGITLSADSKFKGEIGRGDILGVDVRLLVPATYMNLSGESVGAVQRFYKLFVAEILVAYDEMAFEPVLPRSSKAEVTMDTMASRVFARIAQTTVGSTDYASALVIRTIKA